MLHVYQSLSLPWYSHYGYQIRKCRSHIHTDDNGDNDATTAVVAAAAVVDDDFQHYQSLSIVYHYHR